MCWFSDKIYSQLKLCYFWLWDIKVSSSPMPSSLPQTICDRHVNTQWRVGELCTIISGTTDTLWKEAKIRAEKFCLHVEAPLVYMSDDNCLVSH